MTLEELNASAIDLEEELDDEEFEALQAGADEDDETGETESDLMQALAHISELLGLMEKIVIKKGRVVRVPKGITEVMEEAADFIEQWNFEPVD